MLSGWLQDLAAEQLKDNNGVPPLVCPNVIEESFPKAQAAVSTFFLCLIFVNPTRKVLCICHTCSTRPKLICYI